MGQLIKIAMDVLHRDYEENALVAGRLVFDLHKSYRPGRGGGAAAGNSYATSALSESVQPYLDFVLQCYRGLPGSVISNFGGCRVERYLDQVVSSTSSAAVAVSAIAVAGCTSQERKLVPETKESSRKGNTGSTSGTVAR